MPHLRGRHEQAPVVRRLQQEAKDEGLSIAGWQFQSKARAQAIVRAERRLAPALERVDHRALRDVAGREARVAALQRRTPALAPRRRRARRAPELRPAAARANQRIHDRVEVSAQERVGSPDVEPVALPRRHRMRREGHAARERGNVRGIVACCERRCPARLHASGASCDRRQHALAAHQLEHQLARKRPRRDRRRERLERSRGHRSEQRRSVEQRQRDTVDVAKAVGRHQRSAVGSSVRAELGELTRRVRQLVAPEEEELRVGEIHEGHVR